MAPLVARESSRPGWQGPVVDIVEDGEVVGCVFVDDGQMLAEFYAGDDGEPWLYDVADLQRVLDMAAAMLGADVLEGPAPADGDVDPVDQLASEFDPMAVHRGPEDEGFYPIDVSLRIVAACEILGLAVAGLEGFEMREEQPVPAAGRAVAIADAHRGEPWALLRSGCNIQAAAVLEKWATEPSLLVAVEVIDAAGEEYVL